nr:glucose-fructose oxidoreductase domain-containing protein 2 [Leptinotarsa decemlineata]
MLPGIGVFGTGAVVRVLVPILRENGFKIEAIWSQTKQNAQEAARDLKIPFFTDVIDEVLLRKDVDLIFVLCPPNLHAQISVKALGIGKHIVCDKPAGLSQADALKMVGAGQYYPSLISLINHSFRFLPAFTNMKKALKDNYLQSPVTLIDIRIQSGSLFNDSDTFDWRCDDTMGGGTLNLIGSHVVDLITFLTGQRAVKVHGVVRTFTKNTESINGIRNISAPDFCTFQMELQNGILVTATLNSHTVGSTFNQDVMICSSTGHLVVRGGDLFGRKHKASEEVIYLDVKDLQCPVPNNSILPKIFIKGLCKMVSALRESFLPNNEKEGWIKEPVCSAATFEDGLYVQAVLSAIRQSSQTRQWVKVKVLTEQPDKNELLSAVVRRTAITIS